MKFRDDQTGSFEDTLGALDAGASDQRVVKLIAQGAAAVFIKVTQNADLSLNLPTPLETIPSGTSASAPYLSSSPWIFKRVSTSEDHRTSDTAAVKGSIASDTSDYSIPCMRTKTFPYAGAKRYGFESTLRFYSNGKIAQDSYFRDTMYNTSEVCLYVGGESDRAQHNLMNGTYTIEALGLSPGTSVYVGLLKINFTEGKYGLTNNPVASTYISQLNMTTTCGYTNWSTVVNENPKDCPTGLIGTEGETRNDTYLFTFDVVTKAFKISKFSIYTFAEYIKAVGSTPHSYGYRILDDVTLTLP